MPSTDTAPRSFWLQETAGDAPDAPALSGRQTADVAILGGGYVGLWTAIRIKQTQPGCDVVVLEQDICGGGASGRNGGFALSWWPKLASLTTLVGVDDAVRIARQSEAAISEIRDFCHAHAIDADFRRGGWLWTATSAAQIGAWEGLLDTCARAGVYEASAAVVQPAALVRGLRRVALEMGVRIHEHTRVSHFTRHRPVMLTAGGATVRAGTLVIATNAWAAAITELARSIAVISSDMVVTAPAGDQLARLGWRPGLSITDSQTMVDYYRITRDGRVAFGKGGWTIALGGRIGPAFSHSVRRAREVEADFRRCYPALSDVPVTHQWSGPIDRTPSSLPSIGYLGGRRHIVYGIGWSGNGVGPSVVGGRLLAAMALGTRGEWLDHPLIGRSIGRFPPEPIKFIGAHVVRAAVAAKERAEIRDAQPPGWAVRLAKFAPAGLEDKSDR